MKTDDAFHIPVLRTNFNSMALHAAMQTMLEQRYLPVNQTLRGIATRYYFPREGRAWLSRLAKIELYLQDDDGKISAWAPSPELGERFFADFSHFSFLWSAEEVGQISALNAVFPAHQGNPVKDPVQSTTYLHIQCQHFALFVRDMPMMYAKANQDVLKGCRDNLDDRRYFLNLLLTPAGSAHEEIELLTQRPEIEDLVRKIYSFSMFEQENILPLAPIDLT